MCSRLYRPLFWPKCFDLALCLEISFPLIFSGEFWLFLQDSVQGSLGEACSPLPLLPFILVVFVWHLSSQPHWPISYAPSMVPTQWILPEWTNEMWKSKFFRIQHYEGIFSPFYHDTTVSTALAKSIWHQLPSGNIANMTQSFTSVICYVPMIVGKEDDWWPSNSYCLWCPWGWASLIKSEACSFPPALYPSPASFKGRVTEVISTE